MSRPATFVCMLLMCGCAKSSSDVAIEGTVKLAGNPVESAAIMFFPIKGRPISAVVDAAGAYACRLPVGDFRVTVSPNVALPAGWKEGDPVPRPKVTIPPQYSSRAKTPLTASITADTRGPIDFSLD
ncbi:MAG: carboxypeptidase-like regulatory domain-containing protein [Planctomycetota bacterium]